MGRQHWQKGAAAVLILAIGLVVFWPRGLFKDTAYATVVLSEEGDLLGARIADDG